MAILLKGCINCGTIPSTWNVSRICTRCGKDKHMLMEDRVLVLKYEKIDDALKYVCENSFYTSNYKNEYVIIGKNKELTETIAAKLSDEYVMLTDRAKSFGAINKDDNIYITLKNDV